MKKLTIFLLYTSLVGCASHKPPTPTGKWVAVNQAEFTPPNAVLYKKSQIDLKNKPKGEKE
ncbi:hypothetical protein MOMA_02580 [Moraxella macacae 0408225]|uniref:Uncharacterized protein n=1 Tax=Moraxella macacae 0408225 TaxID=1230338 RepID=L2F8M7_9GAMM|nr:hypothetical protein [Moraxella macacae]ELA09255.1 hypothetical protein MOMA_02580 [Moraxella macacae 0408225]